MGGGVIDGADLRPSTASQACFTVDGTLHRDDWRECVIAC